MSRQKTKKKTVIFNATKTSMCYTSLIFFFQPTRHLFQVDLTISTDCEVSSEKILSHTQKLLMVGLSPNQHHQTAQPEELRYMDREHHQGVVVNNDKLEIYSWQS